MRHRVAHRKLGRVTEHRIAMLRNQATALLRHEHLTTTVPRAKELRPFVERLITIAKRGVAGGDANGKALNARRLVMHDLQDREVVTQAVRHASRRGSRRGPAATRACCASGSAGATAPRWRRSSSSAASSIRRAKAEADAKGEGAEAEGQGRGRAAARGGRAAARQEGRDDGETAATEAQARSAPKKQGRRRATARADQAQSESTMAIRSPTSGSQSRCRQTRDCRLL